MEVSDNVQCRGHEPIPPTGCMVAVCTPHLCKAVWKWTSAPFSASAPPFKFNTFHLLIV